MLTNALGVQYDPNGNPVTGDTGAAVPTGATYIAGQNAGNLVGIAVSATGAILTQASAADTVATGNLNSNGAAVTVQAAGQAGVGFQLQAGTLIGTITPQVSYDDGTGGTTWEATSFFDPVTGAVVGSITFASANTAQAKSIYVPPGAGGVRVTVTAFTSGTAVATVRASETGTVNAGQAASGTTAPLLTGQVGGLNAGNLIAFAVDASGRQIAVGAGTTGAAPVGNPVYVAGLGTDANLHAFSTDASGRQIVVGSTAAGSALAGNAVPTGGVTSGGNFEPFLVDAQGRLLVIDEKAGTAAITRVATSTTSANLLASNANRLGATVVNESGNKMFLKFGATASATSYTVQVPSQGYYEVPFDYTGGIDAILSGGTGSAQITELTN